MSIWERLALTIIVAVAQLLAGWLMVVVGIFRNTTTLELVHGTVMFAMGYFLALSYANDRAKSREPQP